ncbi:MAG: class I SAM-dependent methyltransferase [Planctomycetes bacterium]|nr:class I SAM-dependent methyltransferase [Planctomycetota bacterium]
MEYVSCALCGADKAEAVYTISDLKVVRCLKCGLVYTNPRLSDDERARLYSEDYFRNQSSPDVPSFDYIQNKELFYADAQRRLRGIMKFKRSGKILEIGCATGGFLDVAREYGWEPYGVEISPWASDYARNKLGLNVVTGNLEDASFPDSFFDVIAMYHVLEHLPLPKQAIQKAARLLKADGLLVITVPDINSGNARRMKERWVNLVPKIHLYHFSKETLTKLLSENGFGIIKSVREGGTGLLNKGAEGKTRPNPLLKAIKYLNWARPIVHGLAIKLLKRWDFITVYARKRQAL